MSKTTITPEEYAELKRLADEYAKALEHGFEMLRQYRMESPQFREADRDFQRVPTVDTSNPFIARDVPSPDESMLVIRFRNPKGIDFPYLLAMLPESFMSRPNTIVCPGGKMPLAMQLIFTPMIWQLMDRRKRG